MTSFRKLPNNGWAHDTTKGDLWNLNIYHILYIQDFYMIMSGYEFTITFSKFYLNRLSRIAFIAFICNLRCKFLSCWFNDSWAPTYLGNILKLIEDISTYMAILIYFLNVCLHLILIIWATFPESRILWIKKQKILLHLYDCINLAIPYLLTSLRFSIFTLCPISLLLRWHCTIQKSIHR